MLMILKGKKRVKKKTGIKQAMIDKSGINLNSE